MTSSLSVLRFEHDLLGKPVPTFPDHALAQRYHAGRWRWRIKLFDQLAAMLQHRALIDRTLVGDFAAIDRRRRIDRDGAGDPRRGAGGAREQLLKPLAKSVADQGIGGGSFEVIERKRRIDQAAAGEI